MGLLSLGLISLAGAGYWLFRENSELENVRRAIDMAREAELQQERERRKRALQMDFIQSVEALKSRVSLEVTHAGVMDAINTISKENDVEIRSVSFEQRKEENHYCISPSVRMRGKYSGMRFFLQDMQEIPQLTKLKEIWLERETRAGKLVKGVANFDICGRRKNG